MKDKGKRILVVDDSSLVRKIIRHELEEGGYLVEDAEDGLMAITKVADVSIDLITLDVDMPRLGGFDTCRKLLGDHYSRCFSHIKDNRVPIIFVTGNDKLEDRKKGFEIGAADFLTKPFAPGELLAAVDKILLPNTRLKGLTALVVDDSLTARSIIAGSLAREGLEVIEAADGLEALTLLSHKAHEIDIVVTDLVMPRLEGDAFCIKARTELGLDDLPIILLTSADEQDRLLTLFKAGATDYIVKPFAREELVARLLVHLERAKLTKRLRETVKELTEARKDAVAANEAKGVFLTNMSHEIRTPMNAIIGLCELALRLEMVPRLRDYLEKIRTSSHSLLSLINDILDFSKIEAGRLHLKVTNFRLSDVLGNVTDLLGGMAVERGLELIIETSPQVPGTLRGDPLRLGQILINLANNAIKFTERGEIVVKIELVESPGKGQWVQFSVRDTGIGIHPKQIQGLFESFTQADSSTTRRFGGTGLGLTICKRLVEMMGGTIWAASKEGRGSTFSFTLPLEPEEGKEAPTYGSPAHLQGLKALIVDDDRRARKTVGAMLKNLSIEAVSVSSGDDAFEELEMALRKKPYDLVLMDWRMPGMDGMEVSRRIAEDGRFEGRRPKIVMLTAFGRDEIMLQAEKAGVDSFLIKPFKQSLLLDTLMSLFTAESIGRRDKSPIPALPDPPPLDALFGAHVLLVEDNVINQQVATEILETSGLKVTVASNGKEAVEALQRTDFEAVLMDIQMPVMDGYEATRMIRGKKRTLDLPIIAMTANVTQEDREKCLEAGMNDHVAKPIDHAQLLNTLSAWIKPREKMPARAPETQGSAEGEDLPSELPGIQVRAGLERIGGNTRLFKKILSQFCTEFGSTAQDMKRVIDSGDVEKAERLAHTLKGVAGNIGAQDLHLLAKEFELAFRQGTADNFVGLQERLEFHLSRVLHSIDDLLNHALIDPPEASAGLPGPMDRQELDRLLSKLSQLLEQNDLIQDELMDSLRNHFSGTHPASSFSRLEECVMQFDYPAALEALAELKAQAGSVTVGEES